MPTFRIEIPHPVREKIAQLPGNVQAAIHARLARAASDPTIVNDHRSMVLAGSGFTLVLVVVPAEEKVSLVSVKVSNYPLGTG